MVLESLPGASSPDFDSFFLLPTGYLGPLLLYMALQPRLIPCSSEKKFNQFLVIFFVINRIIIVTSM